MGLLDPKINKARTFELLRAKGAVKATVVFSGGNDEGGVDSILLTLGDDSQQNLEPWYCGGYSFGPGGQYVPMSEPANEDEELADLLEGPINESFGSWGGVEDTYGTLTWDVVAGTATMTFDQSEYRSREHTVAF